MDYTEELIYHPLNPIEYCYDHGEPESGELQVSAMQAELDQHQALLQLAATTFHDFELEAMVDHFVTDDEKIDHLFRASSAIFKHINHYVLDPAYLDMRS